MHNYSNQPGQPLFLMPLYTVESISQSVFKNNHIIPFTAKLHRHPLFGLHLPRTQYSLAFVEDQDASLPKTSTVPSNPAIQALVLLNQLGYFCITGDVNTFPFMCTHTQHLRATLYTMATSLHTQPQYQVGSKRGMQLSKPRRGLPFQREA